MKKICNKTSALAIIALVMVSAFPAKSYAACGWLGLFRCHECYNINNSSYNPGAYMGLMSLSSCYKSGGGVAAPPVPAQGGGA